MNGYFGDRCAVCGNPMPAVHGEDMCRSCFDSGKKARRLMPIKPLDRKHFVFKVYDNTAGGLATFYLADKERMLWTEDAAQAQLLLEGEASDLAVGSNTGCGSK